MTSCGETRSRSRGYASAGLSRSGVSGARRRRTPVASKTALAMAAATGRIVDIVLLNRPELPPAGAGVALDPRFREGDERSTSSRVFRVGPKTFAEAGITHNDVNHLMIYHACSLPGADPDYLRIISPSSLDFRRHCSRRPPRNISRRRRRSLAQVNSVLRSRSATASTSMFAASGIR
jgi:hypothetical protein